MTRAGWFAMAFAACAGCAAPGAPPAGSPASPGTTAGAAAPPAPSQACAAPEYRQLDFWIGDWQVQSAKGEVLGVNRIESVLGGCVIRETWTGQGGSGTSLDLYSAVDRKWHYNWVDDHGNLLLLSGGLTGGKMVMSGEAATAKEPGKKLLHRLTWEKVGPARVHQLYESSSDGGKTWTVAFDGIYVPRGETPSGHR